MGKVKATSKKATVDPIPSPRRDDEDGKKKKKQRLAKTAGLELPASRWRAPIRAALKDGKHRISKNADICLVGYMEHLMRLLLEASAKKVTKRSHITAANVHQALKDKESGFYSVFPERITGMH